MSLFLSYSPSSFFIPSESGITRSSKIGLSAHSQLSKKEEISYDTKTLFYDVFLSADRQKLICLGPPFLNIGRPQKIYQKNKPLKFSLGKGSYWFRNQVLTLLKIEILDQQSPILFNFHHFSLKMPFPSQNKPTLEKTQLTLVTLQKDNPNLWIEDWCHWHNEIHKVKRIVIYDNGSSNSPQLIKTLAGLELNCEILLIDWCFPYGPAFSNLHQYAQIGCLNHFRLLFGDSTQWCMQLDIDEYLYSNTRESIRHYLAKIDSQPALYLDSYLVPKQRESVKPARFFHHSIRPHWTRAWAGKKYIYQPTRIKLNLVHRIIPSTLSFFHLYYGVQKRWDLMYRLFMRLLKKTPHKQKIRPKVLFYHFRGLNTGWKGNRKAIGSNSIKEVLNASDYIIDENIINMSTRIKHKQ